MREKLARKSQPWNRKDTGTPEMKKDGFKSGWKDAHAIGRRLARHNAPRRTRWGVMAPFDRLYWGLATGCMPRYMPDVERLDSDTHRRNHRRRLPTAGTSSDAQKEVSALQLVLQKAVCLILLTAIRGTECRCHYFNFTHQEVPPQGNEVNGPFGTEARCTVGLGMQTPGSPQPRARSCPINGYHLCWLNTGHFLWCLNFPISIFFASRTLFF